jgi:hypothetical protein
MMLLFDLFDIFEMSALNRSFPTEENLYSVLFAVLDLSWLVMDALSALASKLAFW